MTLEKLAKAARDAYEGTPLLDAEKRPYTEEGSFIASELLKTQRLLAEIAESVSALDRRLK